jgi:hypothetical protein
MHETELDFLRRVSQQEHPDVLPLCIETLAIAESSTAEVVETANQQHQFESRQDRNHSVLAAAATLVVAYEFGMVEHFSGNYTLTKTAAVVGLITTGIMEWKRHRRDRIRCYDLEHQRIELTILNQYHQNAIEQGKKLGLEDSD